MRYDLIRHNSVIAFQSASNGGVDPRLALFDEPDWPFFLPRRDFSRLPPRMEDAALGLELVDTTDSVGELAPDNCAKLSLNATVSPSVKLKNKEIEWISK